MSKPYHRFVFDTEQRRFVGEFEEMYRREDEEGFDSWHQEDVGEQDRHVHPEAAHRLHCRFRRQGRSETQFQEIAGARPQCPVFRQKTAGLAHQPPGRRVEPLAVQDAQQRFGLCTGHRRSSS